MTQVKKLDFSGTTIYCGVDVHKKSWRVNIQDSDTTMLIKDILLVPFMAVS